MPGVACRRCRPGVADPGNEAVNLGIAIYNMRQGEGIRYETLFRDETVGALDAANGKEYVRMLRRSINLGGFHQVVLICHTPLVWELADSLLSVGDGVSLWALGVWLTNPTAFVYGKIEARVACQ